MNFGTNNFKWGWKVLALFIYAILTIATCAGVWNSHPGAWLAVAAALLFASNATLIFLQGRWLIKQPTGNTNNK